MSNKIFITSTLPYANGNPHIGSAFEFVLLDIFARYLRKNNEVVVNLGLDENGSKILKKSKELNISVQNFISEKREVWKKFCEQYDISYTNFYCTSTPEHAEKVQRVWKEFVKKDLIYKKKYTGKYCIGCESFKTEKELINDKCPDHNTICETVSEENYFFKITTFKKEILDWIKTKKPIIPETKENELINIIEGAEDLCVSRTKSENTWGVDVPDDDTQVIYVWNDALLSYVFSAGYYTYNFGWEWVVQLCGPDNLRFQAFIFQSFLAALGIKFSDTILIHGTILDQTGNKISKTVGNIVDPIDQLNKYNLEAVRYYFALNNTYNDFSWKEEDLVNYYNSHIVDGWGNLINRVFTLIKKYSINTDLNINREFVEISQLKLNTVEIFFSQYKTKEALLELHEIVKNANKYITDNEPWRTGKYDVVGAVYWVIVYCNKYYKLIFPEKGELLSKHFISCTPIKLFKKII